MKHVKQCSWLRIMLISMCVVLSCLVFAFAATLPVFTGGKAIADGEGTEVTDPAEPSEPETETYALTDVELTVRDGYAYTNEISSNPSQMFDLTEVTVTYTQVLAEGSEDEPKTITDKLNLSGTGDTRTADTGETVAFTYAGNQITATVTPRSEYSGETVDGTLAVNFRQREVKGIVAYFTAPSGVELNTLTSLNNIQSGITVYYTYNDGVVGSTSQDIVDNNKYTLSGSLFPVNESPAVGGEYTAQLTITLTDDIRITTVVYINNVKFVQPYSVATRLEGQIEYSQVARSDVKLGTLAVVLYYYVNGRESDISVSLNNFDETWYTISYFDENNGPVDKLSTTAKYAQVNFEYKGVLSDAPDGESSNKKARTSSQEINVSKLSLVRPTFPTNTDGTLKEFATDVNVDVVFPDYKGLFPIDTPDPQLTVDNTADSEITQDGNNYNIKFNAPGTYNITVTLDTTNNNNADFDWANSGGGVVSDNSIIYRVQVDKGDFDVKLTGNFKWTYGTTVDDNFIQNTVKAEVKGTLLNSSNTTPFTFILGNKPSDKDSQPDVFGYELEFYDNAGNKLSDIPKAAGKYKVKAVTYENAYYVSATAKDFTEVTIDPKPIDVTKVIKTDVTYAAKDYTAKDFLNTNEFIPADVNDGLIEVYTDSAYSTSFTSEKYYDANGYAVYLKITNPNYVWGTAVPTDYWDDGTVRDNYRLSGEQKFVINKLKITYSVSHDDFYYGNADKDISVSNSNATFFGKYTPTVKYTIGSTNYSDRTSINTWDAGDYTITYTLAYNGGDAQEDASIDIEKSTTAKFTIKKAQLTAINAHDGATATYGDTSITFTTANYTAGVVSGFGGLGSHADLSTVLSRTVAGDRLGVLSVGDNDSVTALTEADTYTVTVKITDTTNFEWAEGNQTDIEAKWTIKKKGVAKLSGPAADTYDKTDKNVTFVDWQNGLMQIDSVSGMPFVTGTNVTPSEIKAADGSFTVVNAGTYTITVSLIDDKNYTWGNDGDNDSVADTLTYTLDRATVVLVETSGSIDFDESASAQLLPTLQAKSADGTGAESGLTIAYTIFNASDEELTQIIAAGVYTLKVATSGALSGDEANNYVVTTELTYTYTVNSRGLIKPLINTTELTYNGQNQSVYELITNRMNGESDIFGNRIVMIIKQGDTVVDNDVLRSIKTVYSVSGSVAAYTVRIYPAANYSWADGVTSDGTDESGEYFEYEITVKQFELTLTWTQGTLASVYGDTVKPEYSLNKFGTDDVSITVGYKDKDKNVLSSVTDAGNYFVYAQEADGSVLRGADKDNYTLTVTDTPYTVNKKVVTKPVQPSDPFKANFGDGTIANVVSDLDASLIEAVITKGYRPAAWFTDGSGDKEFDVTDTSKYGFDVATGMFTFVNAGYYNVKFTLNGKNHCWDSDKVTDFDTAEYTVDWTDFAQVSRTPVQAPSFNTAGDDNNYRAQEWGDKFDGSKITVTSPVGGMNVKVTYGSTTRPTDPTSATMPWTSKPTQSDIGQYYILIELSSSDDMLNYVWNDSADKLPSFVAGTDEKEYTENKVSVLLRYAITGAQLPLTFNAIEYVFGANDNTGIDLFTALKDSLTDSAKALLDAANSGNGIEFNDVNIKLSGIKYDSGVDTENDLPWNVGDYSVELTITFVNHGVYQPLPVKTDISVSPRPIEVRWDNLEKTYDGEKDQDTVFNGTATLINLPVRSSGEIDKPALTVRANEGDVVNAKTYNIKVKGLSGANDKNLTYVGAVNYDKNNVKLDSETVEFVVNKRAVSIQGVSNTDHVYGETLPSGSGTAWEYASGSAELVGDDANRIAVKITTADDTVASLGTLPDVGDYKIVPYWNGDTATSLESNYGFTFAPADFKVLQREISIDLADIGKVYYDTVDYTGAYTDKINSANGTGNAIVGDLPFVLVAKDGGNEITQSSPVNISGYTLFITQTSGNYKITVNKSIAADKVLVLNVETETSAKYIINNADLDPTVIVNGGGTYNATQYNYLDKNTVADGTNANAAENDLKWFIGIVSSAEAADTAVAEWKEYGDLGQTNAGTYYFFVKVTAKNHNEKIISLPDGKPFSLTIGNATLSVTVKGRVETYSGSNIPYLYNNTATGVELADNDLVWKVADAGAYASAEDVPDADWKAADYGKTDWQDGGYDFFVKVTADNHDTFYSGKLTLTINKAVVSVQVRLEIFFNEDDPAERSYMMNVSDLTDAANADKLFFIANNAFKTNEDRQAFYDGTLLNGTFSYAVPNYSKGKDIGGYTIVPNFKGLNSTNYKFEAAASGNILTVKALPVKVTVDAYTATYNQARETLTPLAATVVCTQSSTYGDGNIDISNIAVTDIVTGISTEALKDGAITTNDVLYEADNKTYKGYDIDITVSGNFDPAYDKATYTITRAKNAITTENYHLFVTEGKAAKNSSPVAWTYGDKTESNANGYDKDGVHALQTLALVSRDNDLTIKITRDGVKVDERVAVSSVDATTLLKNIFGDIYVSNASFVAGDYAVSFTMNVSNNFDDFSETWKFTVAKKEIAVTPNNIDIKYGEDLPDPANGVLHTNKYTYTHTPLAGYNGNVDDLTAAVTFVFGSSYSVGGNVDKYTISVQDPSGTITTSDGKTVSTVKNYIITFDTATLTVGKREVSIEINPAYNHYMLIGAYNNDPNDPAYDDETAWLLDERYDGKKYEIKSGSFYNDIVPFEIKTQALTYNNDTVTGTLDFGRYAIYAEFIDDTFKGNYKVTVVNAAYGDNVNVPTLGDLAIMTDGKLVGGVFDVLRAQLYMTVTGPYYDDNGTLKLYSDNPQLAHDAGVYDGRAKHYKAEAALGNKTDLLDGKVPQFVPEYYNGQTPLDGAPVDKGSYIVRFAVDGSSENDNFEQTPSQSQTINISARALTVSSGLGGANYKYTYRGSAYDVQFSFDNLVSKDDLAISVKVNGVNKNYTLSSDNTAIRRHTESFENVNSYTIEIELSADMTNYILSERVIDTDKEYTSGGVYTCKLDITKKDLYVWIKDATVQYGTTVFNPDGTLATKDARFSGFGVAYSESNSEVNQTETGLQSIISANKTAGHFVDASGGITYTANGYSVTSVFDSTFTIVMPYLSADNFELHVNEGTLSVIKRKINVTVKGADENNDAATRVYNGVDNSGGNHTAYLNANLATALGAFLTADADAFGATTESLSDLDIGLSVSTAAGAVKNVGFYDMTVAYNNANYDVTFKYGAQGKARYQITPETLKVKVQKANTEFETAESRLTVTYGSDVSGYGVSFSGFVDGETSTLLNGYMPQYSFKYGEKTYRAYASRVGEVYTVSVRFGSGDYQPLTNYTIDYIDTTKLDITPLKISITVEASNVYREANDGYHDGVYGASMEAGVTLSGYDAVKCVVDGVNYAPGFTRSYSTSEASYNGVKYQEQYSAPRRVGEYTVTVSLESHTVESKTFYDYCFDTDKYSVTSDYEITQQVIDLAWKNPTIHSSDSDKSNSIADYRSSIMKIDTFTRDTAPLDTADCSVSDEDPGLTYNAASSAGRYTITIELIESARHNYRWGTAINAEGTQTSAFFTITGQGVVVIGDQSILGWIYGEYKPVNAPTATLYPYGSTDPITDAVPVYYFALVTGSNTDGIDKTGNKLESFNRNDYETVGEFTLGIPSNAGVYVMRVDFDGNATYSKATSVYYIFRIERKGIDKPTVGQSVYSESNGAVTVEQTVAGFDSAVMRIIGFDGVQTSYEGTTLTVGTVNANESGYNIRVELSDANYYWIGAEEASAVDVKWIVKSATDNHIEWDADHAGREYEYGKRYTIAAIADYNVNGNITYSYATRSNGVTVDKVTDWTNGLPVNAGKYWIRAVSSTDTGNYNTADITTEFEITQAVLHVKPSGSAQYGALSGNADAAAFSRYDFVDTDSFGFKYTDTVDAVRSVIASNGITYTVAGTPDTAWTVDTYDLTMSATHINYDIQCVTGVFEITKRTLNVTVGNNGASYYGHAVDYSKVTISVGALVNEADRAEIIAKIRAALDAGIDETSDADVYTLTVESSLVLDNYVLSVTDGVYTVNKLPVIVTADWGGYAFGATEPKPRVTAVYDGTNNTLLTFTADELKSLFPFVYADGTTTAPTTAGSHPVSVNVAENCNYVLYRPVSGLFVISLTELDATLINWTTVYFDTVCAKPTVASITGNEFSESMFTIEYIGDWNRAGVAYTIRLKLTSPQSTKWKSVEGATRDITYTIAQGQNALVENISISGWVYGDYSADNNTPTARAKFGTVVFEYSDARDGVYTTAAPANGNVGTYWVRAVVEGTTDYARFVSPEPVHFEITKKTITAPALNIITEGYGQNNVYTGTAMQAEVSGYDSTLMYIRYDDGTMIVNGNNIKVVATNAGDYRVTVTLVNADNYGWAAGTTLDADGNAQLTWSIARKKLIKPTDNNATLIVNGQELTYYPIGFDGETMEISGNTSGYGGTFTATVSIKDTENYEWADGTTDSVTFEWNVVGADTVFTVVISILSVLAGAAAIGAGVQLFFYMKKKKEERAE